MENQAVPTSLCPKYESWPVPQKGTDFWCKRFISLKASWAEDCLDISEGAIYLRGFFFFFNHLSLQVDDITPGGNSVKIFKEFREGPGKVLGRGH